MYKRITSRRSDGRYVASAALALLLIITCSGRELARREASEGLRVLFIGNSLTYTNDLPSLVEAMAKAAGRKRFTHKSVVFGGFSLEDHWNRGDARRAIAEGGWDVVVLQQGPSALPESRRLLIEYTRRFSREIRAAGARPAVYMVWPSTGRPGDFDAVSESYRLAAEDVGGMLFPAGEAWRAAWRRDPGLALYSPDGLHPTMAGSYLSALVIYEQLYEGLLADPRGSRNPGRLKGFKIDLTAEQLDMLWAAAREANERFGRP
jgi:hypothetical protein